MTFPSEEHLASLDFSQLALPDLVTEYITSELEKKVYADVRNFKAKGDLTGSVSKAILSVVAMREQTLRSEINRVLAQVQLSSATGDNLDNLALVLNTPRKYRTPETKDSSDGQDLIPESDTDFRHRASIALAQLSDTGSFKSYRYKALAAHPQVKDIKVYSTEAGRVTIKVLDHRNDGTPEQEVLNAVTAALSSTCDRPMTDIVDVGPANIINYSAAAVVVVDCANAKPLVETAIDSNLNEYIELHNRFDTTISRSAIISTLYVDYVNNVHVYSPHCDLVTASGQAPYAKRENITLAVQSVEPQPGALGFIESSKCNGDLIAVQKERLDIERYTARPKTLSGALTVKLDETIVDMEFITALWGDTAVRPLDSTVNTPIFKRTLRNDCGDRSNGHDTYRYAFQPNKVVPENASHILLYGKAMNGETIFLDSILVDDCFCETDIDPQQPSSESIAGTVQEQCDCSSEKSEHSAIKDSDKNRPMVQNRKAIKVRGKPYSTLDDINILPDIKILCYQEIETEQTPE